MKLNNATTRLVMTGLFAAMITIMTAFICHIPYGANGGYVHFGDALIFIAASILPRPYAMAAAMIGGGLADLLTAPMWAPATILIKMLVALSFTSKEKTIVCKRNIGGIVFAASATILGYYVAEGLLFGSFVAAVASILGNVIQCAGSAVIFVLLGGALDHVGVKTRLTTGIYS